MARFYSHREYVEENSRRAERGRDSAAAAPGGFGANTAQSIGTVPRSSGAALEESELPLLAGN